eukprot:364297-Chlamydomonas_euryale.AAC.2
MQSLMQSGKVDAIREIQRNRDSDSDSACAIWHAGDVLTHKEPPPLLGYGWRKGWTGMCEQAPASPSASLTQRLGHGPNRQPRAVGLGRNRCTKPGRCDRGEPKVGHHAASRLQAFADASPRVRLVVARGREPDEEEGAGRREQRGQKRRMDVHTRGGCSHKRGSKGWVGAGSWMWKRAPEGAGEWAQRQRVKATGMGGAAAKGQSNREGERRSGKGSKQQGWGGRSGKGSKQQERGGRSGKGSKQQGGAEGCSGKGSKQQGGAEGRSGKGSKQQGWAEGITRLGMARRFATRGQRHARAGNRGCSPHMFESPHKCVYSTPQPSPALPSARIAPRCMRRPPAPCCMRGPHAARCMRGPSLHRCMRRPPAPCCAAPVSSPVHTWCRLGGTAPSA